ncbi:ribosome-associated translation inhibitor RaiA [Aquibium sp. ELW1220]|uniref:ribosome hibernation-promoting factor, HPF/YfiA family n=1 Tax=Aquibium sp. ELW1220 TaxID=2976766 RepID=UPI0025B0830B|nr:ribosome-associated translation inhibitor RaiA [Aquibium sp. ELW1220]MDN2578421.1 ribosome-associated translation inhibitor RaiA [Aquibium sp. ELW1220]
MGLRISGKQMEMGEAFRTRIDQRIEEAISKYFDGGFSGHVTVEKAGARYSADCRIHLDTGMELQAEGRAMDPQLAFDAAAERIEKRLRRYKRRLKSHQAVSPEDAVWTDVPYRVMAPAAEEDEEVPEDYAPAIVAETSLTLKTMSVAGAVIELDTKESPVQVFRNAGTGKVNIVYRRSDGNIGWIDPSAVAGEGA